MKKLFLFLAATALMFASCNNNDDNDKEYLLSAEYLKGTWKETVPAANHVLDFGTTTAKLTSVSDSTFQNYNYSVQDSLLTLSIPGNDYDSRYQIEIVDKKTIKLTTLYIYFTCPNCPQVTSTFKKD